MSTRQEQKLNKTQCTYAGILAVSRIFLTSVSLSLEWVKWCTFCCGQEEPRTGMPQSEAGFSVPEFSLLRT